MCQVFVYSKQLAGQVENRIDPLFHLLGSEEIWTELVNFRKFDV